MARFCGGSRASAVLYCRLCGKLSATRDYSANTYSTSIAVNDSRVVPVRAFHTRKKDFLSLYATDSEQDLEGFEDCLAAERAQDLALA